MTRSDKTLIALNSMLGLWTFVAFASQDMDALLVGSMLTMAVVAANIGMAFRRRNHEPAPKRPRRRKTSEPDEMDAATVLDLDARLEALERARAVDDDAARLWAMAQRGEVSAPAAEPAQASDQDNSRAHRESA